ncbi:UNVERIFIED_CONTAM: hypothetical protein Cloal_1057 [Acetivibrio alkalicellulosi]
MNKLENYTRTNLNENDRKILDKYTKVYTNFIESTSAKNELLEDDKLKIKR